MKCDKRHGHVSSEDQERRAEFPFYEDNINNSKITATAVIVIIIAVATITMYSKVIQSHGPQANTDDTQIVPALKKTTIYTTQRT